MLKTRLIHRHLITTLEGAGECWCDIIVDVHAEKMITHEELLGELLWAVVALLGWEKLINF